MRSLPALALTTSIVTAAGLALGGVAAAHPSASAAPAARPAAVTKAAAHGGRVIVTLRDQFHGLAITAHGNARANTTHASQRGVVDTIRSHGGRDVLRLTSVNAVAARVSEAEIQRLRADPDVASISRDMPMHLPAPAVLQPADTVSQRVCPTDPSHPLLEPEALGLTHYESQPARSTDADTIATGQGVTVGLTGINGIAGNPNFIRPDGQHVIVGSPTPNAQNGNFQGGADEWYGDASSIGGQGTVTYDFAKELPHSKLPVGCTFKIVGIAPGASLIDTGYFGQGNSRRDGAPETESQQIAGLDRAAARGASVVSESYGYGAIPGQTNYNSIAAANDELVASGITVVESAGDSGVGGTVEAPGVRPELVIDAGATTSLPTRWPRRGVTGSWESDQMAAALLRRHHAGQQRRRPGRARARAARRRCSPASGGPARRPR